MNLILKAHDTIQTIQEHFSAIFPYLRLEFYHTKHQPGEANVQADQYLHNVTLQTVTGSEQDIEIAFHPEMKTKDLELLFETQCKLYVQLMRKQSGTWLQTTRSDEQTLAQQNQHGADMDAFKHTKQQLDEAF